MYQLCLLNVLFLLYLINLWTKNRKREEKEDEASKARKCEERKSTLCRSSEVILKVLESATHYLPLQSYPSLLSTSYVFSFSFSHIFNIVVHINWKLAAWNYLGVVHLPSNDKRDHSSPPTPWCLFWVYIPISFALVLHFGPAQQTAKRWWSPPRGTHCQLLCLEHKVLIGGLLISPCELVWISENEFWLSEQSPVGLTEEWEGFSVEWTDVFITMHLCFSTSAMFMNYSQNTHLLRTGIWLPNQA